MLNQTTWEECGSRERKQTNWSETQSFGLVLPPLKALEAHRYRNKQRAGGALWSCFPQKWHPHSLPKRIQLSRDCASRWCWFTCLAVHPGRQRQQEPGLQPCGCVVPPRPCLRLEKPWPRTADPSSMGAGVQVNIAEPVPKVVAALPSKWDSLACNWVPAGLEGTHVSNGE